MNMIQSWPKSVKLVTARSVWVNVGSALKDSMQAACVASQKQSVAPATTQ